MIKPLEVIPASGVNATCTELLIIIPSFSKVLNRGEQRRERRMVGKRMMLESM